MFSQHGRFRFFAKVAVIMTVVCVLLLGSMTLQMKFRSGLQSLYTSLTQLPATQPPENENLTRTYCDMKYEDGEMCPRLYTDLGGVCNLLDKNVWNCMDIRTRSGNDLRQAQLAMTRVLRIFDLVCRKHGIKYWMTSATLLGAARHKGFIPWDSDIDVEIPLDDYERFFKVASKDLPADVFFQNTESDLHLRPDPDVYPGLYEARKYKDIGMYERTWNPRLRDRYSCYRYCIQMGCKWHDGLMVDMYVVKAVPDNYYPLKELLFEGFPFAVPNNWAGVLREKYGDDYMIVPGEGSKNRVRWDWPDALHGCEELDKDKEI